MWHLFGTFLITATASLLLTAAVRRVARRWGVLDHPDGARKLHRQATPLWGGVAVYLALLFGLALVRYGTRGVGESLDELSAAIAAGGGFVCFFGCLDDVYRLSARAKLLLQIVAVLPVVLAGCHVDRIAAFGVEMYLGWFGVPLTVLWLLGCINALNLLDGMDGLASLVGLATVTMLGVVAAYTGNLHVTVVAIVLAGAIAGFLAHNLPPAKIFLGDSGSMAIGLIIGLLGIQSTLKTSTTLAITAPLVIMTFPMFDTFLAIVRRRMTGNRLATADRQHIHHRLLDRGLKPWLVLAIIGALCLLTGVAAAVATILRSDWLAWMTAGALLVLVVRLRLFGHHEWRLLANALQDSARQSLRLIGRSGEEATLVPSPLGGPRELWAQLLEQLQPWNVQQIELLLTGADSAWSHVYRESADGAPSGSQWMLAVRTRDGSGRCCELRVATAGSPRRAARSFAALSTTLERFAEGFGRCSALDLGLPAPVRPPADGPEGPVEPLERKKAA
jgi:UDP-GlcNAc:undecaprenyl-phosphate GlcNAc-1-phosphate transferase